MEEKQKVIVVNESTSQSIISDIFTFGIVMLCFWLNYRFCGDSVVITLLLSVCFFAVTLSKFGNRMRKMTVEEAREYFKQDVNCR